MENQFPLSPAAAKALTLMERHGYEAYVVGGCVRDFLMHIPPHDFDITTSATPDETKQVFKDFRVILTGEKHGTVTVLMDDEPLEITTFRKDGDYLDGRHPEKVEFTSAIEEDLMRRDFTVNAMAYSPLRGLCDPFHGQEDLKNGILRCVGDAPTRFTEDALRLMRALRFGARLSFTIEDKTADAIHALAPAITKVSRERVLSEMNGLLQAKDAVPVMTRFRDMVCAAVPQLAAVSEADYAAALAAMEKVGKSDLTLRWAALLSPLGQNAMQALLNLKAPKRLTEAVHALINAPDTIDQALVKPLMCCLGPVNAEKLCLLRAAQGLLSDADALIARIREVQERGECYQLSMLAVTGKDLMSLGVQGKAIGETLHKLLDLVLLDQLPNEKQALLSALSSFSLL